MITLKSFPLRQESTLRYNKLTVTLNDNEVSELISASVKYSLLNTVKPTSDEYLTFNKQVIEKVIKPSFKYFNKMYSVNPPKYILFYNDGVHRLITKFGLYFSSGGELYFSGYEVGTLNYNLLDNQKELIMFKTPSVFTHKCHDIRGFFISTADYLKLHITHIGEVRIGEVCTLSKESNHRLIGLEKTFSLTYIEKHPLYEQVLELLS